MRDYSVCCIKGCDKPSVALGLCVNHWRRNKRYGSPVALKSHVGMFIGKPPEVRFAMQIKKQENGCWIWTGGTDQDGYGGFRAEAAGQMHQRAHRWSWSFHNKQPIPRGGMICHTCDTPRCVNPAHLFLGDALINMRDKITKGRARVAQGEQAGRAILTAEQAREILADPRPYAAIAADYNVSPGAIGSIKQRVSWQSLGDVEVARAPRVSPRKGVSDKITPDVVREIRASAEPGKVLAARYGVSVQTVCDIRKRRSWAHVE